MNKPVTIGPYEIVRRLGGGGMAETFLAVRRGHDGFTREVCIKRIYPHTSADETNRRRFLQEAKLLSALRHSAIVMAEDAGFDPVHGHYFVMEYVHGIDLDGIFRYCAETGALFPADAAAYVAAAAAEALHHGHTLVIDGQPSELIHRDVSPNNLLVDINGHVKLIDFGISLLVGASKFTATNMMPANIRFMSPEHSRRSTLDPRSDLFSLGIVLHLALTGAHPFDDGRDELEAIRDAIEDAVQFDPRHLQEAHVPAPLAELVSELLAPSKDARPESGDRVAARLDGSYRPYAARIKLAQLCTEAVAHAAERRAASQQVHSDVAASHPYLPDTTGGLALARDAPALTTSAEKKRARPLRRAAWLGGAATLLLLIALYGFQRTSLDRLAPPAASVPANQAVGAAPPAHDPKEARPEPQAVAPSALPPVLQPAPSIVADAAITTTDASSEPLARKASLRVRVVAGCIVLDGKKRQADTLVARDLNPGPHTIGLAPDCSREVAEEHQVVLLPGKNSRGYPYSAGATY